MSIKENLIKKYSINSKHSNYQILPSLLKFIIKNSEVKTKTRFEKERLNYVLKKIDIKNKKILDIGGNTGFFTFELLHKGAGKIHYYEGNKDHAEFVMLASEYLDLTDKIEVTDKYFIFKNNFEKKYDIIFLLNVLHHFGDDYGNRNISIEEAKNNILIQLNSLKGVADTIVFQLGFNWKGNPSNCLFEHGTKEEMIEFISIGLKENWNILNVGIAKKVGNKVEYFDLDNDNIRRDDSLGEFLNRPIFILSKK